jgi:hypothetical protein
LFVALGGTAIAAKRYLITSTSQIKPSVLTAIRGQTVAAGHTTVVVGPTAVAGPFQVARSEAPCPAGYSALSGGYQSVGPDAKVFVNEPMNPPNGWVASISNPSPTGASAEVNALAICAPAGKVVAARRQHGNSQIAAVVKAEQGRLDKLRNSIGVDDPHSGASLRAPR